MVEYLIEKFPDLAQQMVTSNRSNFDKFIKYDINLPTIRKMIGVLSPDEKKKAMNIMIEKAFQNR